LPKATFENPFSPYSGGNSAVLRQTSSQGTKPCFVGFPCPTKFPLEIRLKQVSGGCHMPFPVISPAFYKELAGDEKQNAELSDYCDVFISAAAVEYVLYLSERKVVRKLMEIDEPLGFIMTHLNEEDEEKVLPVCRGIIEENPVTAHYWLIRVLIMNILQNKELPFEKRMLLLNYALKKVNGLSEPGLSDGIPEFITEFTANVRFDETLKLFEGVRPAPLFSLADGISLLKSLSGAASPEYNAIMGVIYKNLETTPDTLNAINVDTYRKLRDGFTTDYLLGKPHYIENIMVNYVWTYSIPFAYSSKLSIWDNYVFFCSVYNALKVLIACYMPGRADGDFADAVSSFDDALRRAGGDIAVRLVDAVKNAGQDNNGDLAVLVLS
jgi:hypothetical protein